MFSSYTSQQLVINLQQHDCLNILEQQLLVDRKPCFNTNNGRGLINRLINMWIYSEFYKAEEQRTIIGAARVGKQRKKITNIPRKLALFHYFVRTSISRCDSDE